MKVLVSGASGLIGSELVSVLRQNGDTVVKLVRHETTANDEIEWDPDREKLSTENVEGFDAVVHLAGESIASEKWNEAKKTRIRDSRVQGTRLLSRTLAALNNPPKVFVSASAMGYYGDRGNDFLLEESPVGPGFLASVCREWEQSTLPASDAGIRTSNARFGLVLSKKGGALAKMLPVFEFGAGGPLGSGRQYVSWITLDDAVRAVQQIINEPGLSGPVNVVSPNPLTNAEFAKTLGHVLGRPAVVPVPAFAAELLLGQMAEELLLSSQRVEPAKLRASHFEYKYPELERALRHTLNRNQRVTT